MSGWTFEKIWSTAVTGRQMVFDGKFVWVTCSDGVRLFDYWGATSGNEPAWDTQDSKNRNQYDTTKLTLFKFIPISGGAYWIVQGGNKMYVSNAASITAIRSIDISTWEVSAAVTTPETMNSNMCWDSDKLWMVGTHPVTIVTPDQQKLHRWDGSAWAYTYIPQRKSTTRTWLAAPHTNKVYVTTYNNVAVCKFDGATGAYETSIRMNAFPVRLTATSERELFCNSYAGMITTINTTDDTVTNGASTLGEDVSGMALEPGGQTFWFINTNNRLGRLNRIDNTAMWTLPVVEGIALNDDWKIETTGFTETTFDDVLVTPSFNYSVWNGTSFDQVTLQPYLFVLSGSKLHCLRLVSPFWRENFYEINGQAAIVTGDKQYFGETS